MPKTKSSLKKLAAALSRKKQRQMKFRASGRSENSYRKFAIENSRAGKGAKNRSEKSRARWRSDKGRDEKIFRFIRDMLRSKTPVRFSKNASHTVSSAKRILAENKAFGSKDIPYVGLPHWDHADERLKMFGWGMASWEMGAQPFSLGLGPEVIEAASRSKKGFARYLQDRISQKLRAAGVAKPEFWFAVERGVWDEPHLHGALVLSGLGIEAARVALRKAGDRQSSSDLKISRKRGPATWVSYSTKWLYLTRAKVKSDNSTAATHGIRRNSKNWYQLARARSSVIYPM